MDTRELLNEHIYPSLNAGIIFSDLDGFRVEKEVITGACPVCKRKAHFFCYHNSRYGKCHAGSCSASQKPVSWWEHTAERYNLTKKQDILHKLAELANKVHLLGSQAEKSDRRDKPVTVQDAMKMIHELGQRAVQTMPEGFIKYLTDDRGFDAELIRKSGILYVEREQFLKNLFKAGASKELLSLTGIFTRGFGEIYKLLLPYPDENGGHYGFVGRLNFDLVPDDGERPKYKNGFGTRKEVPYLFHTANKPGYHKMVVVEGPFDAQLIKHRCELKGTGVIALCGDKLGEVALTQVNMAKPPVVVLALDDDPAGRMSSLALVRVIKKRVFVVRNFGGYKDPGDLIAAKGPIRFKERLLGAIPASQWVFMHLFTDIRSAGAGGRVDILADVAPIFHNLKCDEDRAQFIEEARSATLLNEATVKALVGA